MLICFDLAVAKFPGQELTSPLTRFLHPFIASHSECVLFGKLCANIRIELGLLMSVTGTCRDQCCGWEGNTVLRLSVSNEGVRHTVFLLISIKLSEDSVQKKMSSLCMELMKLRTKRDAKEKVSCFVLCSIDLFRDCQ